MSARAMLPLHVGASREFADNQKVSLLCRHLAQTCMDNPIPLGAIIESRALKLIKECLIFEIPSPLGEGANISEAENRSPSPRLG
jgi:hypothetical protein